MSTSLQNESIAILVMIVFWVLLRQNSQVHIFALTRKSNDEPLLKSMVKYIHSHIGHETNSPPPRGHMLPFMILMPYRTSLSIYPSEFVVTLIDDVRRIARARTPVSPDPGSCLCLDLSSSLVLAFDLLKVPIYSCSNSVLLTTFALLSPNHAVQFYNLLGSPQPFDAQRNYVTSPWFSPTILAVIRGIIAFYTLFALLFILIWQAIIEGIADSFVFLFSNTLSSLTHILVTSYFSYFTELTYIGICSYYWASFTQTFVYARRRRLSPHKTPEYPLQRWPRILQLLHVMLGTTIVLFRA